MTDPLLRFWFVFLVMVAGASGQKSLWRGCEQFPGFGSAEDTVVITIDKEKSQGSFDILTSDFLYSRQCNESGTAKPDVIWQHQGVFTCMHTGNGTQEVAFKRSSLFIQPLTRSGLLFSKVLCPHAHFTVGNRTSIPVGDIPTLCSSISFNNCVTFFDHLSVNGTDGLRRSSAPSCMPSPVPPSNGPVLACQNSAANCIVPCQ